MSNEALGSFLRARRAKIRPDQAGLPVFGRRRVPGLRREELAQLAGVSPDYYVRLEQGRGRNVSDAVLDSVARVLQLDDIEREHLFNLVRTVPKPAVRPQRVHPGVRQLLDMMDHVPAFVLGPRMDVLAWNALGDAVMAFSAWPTEARNVPRQIFLDPRAATFYPDWDAVAADAVGYLTFDAGRHPDDPLLAALVRELAAGSAVFPRLWAGQRVTDKRSGRKQVRHPRVGDLDLAYETLALPGEPDQILVTYTAAPGTPTHDRLRLLAADAAARAQDSVTSYRT